MFGEIKLYIMKASRLYDWFFQILRWPS